MTRGNNPGLGAYAKTAHPGASLSPAEREKLILDYAPLIRFIAGRMAVRLPAHLNMEDLFSAGVLGLIDAVDKYDPSHNAQFRTYAEYRIRGAMLDELRALDWVPRSVRQKSAEIDKTIRQLAQELKREPSDEEVAQRLGMDLEEYYQRLTETAGINVFAIVHGDEDGEFLPGTLVENAIKDSSDGPEQLINKDEVRRVIAKAIERLEENEQIVISLYYYDELTMKEIGKVLSYTESRICQIHSKAMHKLRSRLRSYFQELA